LQRQLSEKQGELEILSKDVAEMSEMNKQYVQVSMQQSQALQVQQAKMKSQIEELEVKAAEMVQ